MTNFAFRWVAIAVVSAFPFLGCGGGPSPRETSPAQSQAADAQRKAEEARQRLESSEGGKVVLRAIEAHGGLEAWYSAPTSSYSWEYSNAGAKLRFKSHLVADNNTRQVYHTVESIGTPEEVQPYDGRFAWDGKQAWMFPADMPRINPRFWALTGYYFEQIPFVLADPGLAYEKLPDEDLDGKAYDMVKVGFSSGVGDAPGDTYTLYVDKDNGMLRGIRYTVTFYNQAQQEKAGGKKAGPPRETLFLYEDFQEVDGLKVATHFRGSTFADGKPGEFRNEAWCTDISFRKPFDATQLKMPEGGKVVGMPGDE